MTLAWHDASGSRMHTSDPGEPTTGKPRLSITPEEGGILSALAARRRVLEIGTGLGVSTRALARWAPEVVTVDVDPWVAEHIAPALNTAVNISCRSERPVGLLTNPRIGLAVDLVFIDADHSTDAVRADIEYARTLDPLVIVCHDAQYPNIAAALDDSWLLLPTYHGLAVCAM